MELRELFTLSLKALLANKLRSILTTLGVIIGVFAVILLVSVGSGLQAYITDQISSLGSNLIYVIPGRVGGARTPGGIQTNKLTIDDAKYLETKLKGLAQVGPVIQKTSTIKFKNKSDKGVSILGTSANYPEIVKTSVTKGIYFTESQERAGNKVVLIGKTVQNNLFGSVSSIGQRITIAGQRYW
jgi:putative ABC transport system permease protein